MKTEHVAITPMIPGQSINLIKHTFGELSGTRTAYVQAGLHADEHPGMLVIQHLITLLQDLEQQGRIKGEIVLVPFANPIGMMQNVLGHWTGRFNIADGQNFNRNFSDIYQELCIRNPMLETDLKQIVSNIMHHLQPIDTVSYMKHVLLKEALKHDIVLDLHSDTSAVLHLYSNIKHAKKASTLAGALGAQVVFVEEFAGGQPFDETIFRCWKWFVEKDYINYDKIPFSVTVELRGHSDVSDHRLDLKN